jgi:signal transduction histidine kinase
MEDKFTYKKLKPEHRKFIHFGLLACVVILQAMVILYWYNERSHETKTLKTFDAISASNKVDHFTNEINNSFINSQVHFNEYVNQGDKESLTHYSSKLNEMSVLIDSLSLMTKNNDQFKKLLAKNNQAQAEIIALNTTINSILERQINPNSDNVSNLFNFNKFKYESILNSIKIESETKKDSVVRKGLFSRIGNALAGKSDLQKERSKITVTMKYKDKVSSGSIEDQIKDLFLTTNNYYENEFKNLKKTFANIKNKNLKAIALNNELLKLSKNVIKNYNNSASILRANNQKDLQDQYKSHTNVRNYTIMGLILLMFVISILLFNFTRLAFEYEKRLTIAQNQIRESLNFKNRIVSMISHDIRSPLNMISIYSKKISSSIKDINIKENFEAIEFTTNSLLLLTNQILEYSKNENVKMKLKPTRFNLKSEIDKTISSMAPLIENKGNQIELKSNLNPNCFVYSDSVKIQQLFYNLIGNANKFTDNGLLSITIDSEQSSEQTINLKVLIQDNGIGIAESDLKNIFKSYYQGTVSEKVNDLGVGLGLNLCKEIIELFEGNINVQSIEGKGTKFEFNLILEQIQE